MSRVGKQPIPIPSGVEITIDGAEVTVKGPNGTLSRTLSPDMELRLTDGVLEVTRPSDSHQHRALHGLTRTLVANMVEGVTNGFRKELEIVGIGYRAQMTEDTLTMLLGFSHPVGVTAPPGITLEVVGNNRIVVTGINKEQVGQAAANLRAWRKPEPYKGKGIRYANEIVYRKAGKGGRAAGR